MASLTITQGADCTVYVRDIRDAAGNLLDLTGWSVRAQVRRSRDSPLLAEWVSGTPTTTQGSATGLPGGVAELPVPAAMSEPWTWGTARIHVECTEPAPGTRQTRPGEADLVLSPAIVHD